MGAHRMQVVRPVEGRDLKSLLEFHQSGTEGIISLPKSPSSLQLQIERSIDSFHNLPNRISNALYQFVLEDTHLGKVVGGCVIMGSIDGEYCFESQWDDYNSDALELHNKVELIKKCITYQGAALLCSLFLEPDYRGKGMGKLLSCSRYLFLTDYQKVFPQKIIVDMRSYQDKNGDFPFYEFFLKNFIGLPQSRMNDLLSKGHEGELFKMVPDHPIPVPLLHESAKEALGKPHIETQNSYNIFIQEGFRFNKRVNFDSGGPILESDLEGMHTFQHSKVYCVESIQNNLDGKLLMASNQKPEYRVGFINAKVGSDQAIVVDSQSAKLLLVNKGDWIRIRE